MSKTIIFLIAILTTMSSPAFTQEINSGDLVDLHGNHWAFKSSVEIIDKYNFLKGFPDHTFRGNKPVNRYELSSITLKLLKHIEKTKKIKLKKRNFVLLEPENNLFKGTPTDHWAKDDLDEISMKYELILLPPDEKNFNGEKYVSRYELAFALGKVIDMVEKAMHSDTDENPYIKKAAPEKAVIKSEDDKWFDKGVKRMKANAIMLGPENGNFNGDTPIDRYQLAVTLLKTIRFIEANY